MLGANVGRPGILTQCAVEEATELDLGMRGYTAYAETVSVYGTEDVFMDGDDTPWSKAFLASCYASRGVKMSLLWYWFRGSDGYGRRKVYALP